MSKHYRAWKIDETQLLPASVQDYVPEDHLSRLIVALVRESLDLSEIECQLRGQSRSAAVPSGPDEGPAAQRLWAGSQGAMTASTFMPGVDLRGPSSIARVCDVRECLACSRARASTSAFDDPKVPGGSPVYVSQARTGGLSGTIGLAEDPSRFSIAWRGKSVPITVDLSTWDCGRNHRDEARLHRREWRTGRMARELPQDMNRLALAPPILEATASLAACGRHTCGDQLCGFSAGAA